MIDIGWEKTGEGSRLMYMRDQKMCRTCFTESNDVYLREYAKVLRLGPFSIRLLSRQWVYQCEECGVSNEF